MALFHQPQAIDPQIAQIILLKAELIWEMRKYLHANGALEIPMPLLHSTREGAPIDQWHTHHPHTKQRWYLRHCMEDHLRRVSIAHRRVFEIGKAIRADAEDSTHAHEFVVLELVFRGFGYDEGINLIKGLFDEVIAGVVNKVCGKSELFQKTVVRKWDDIFEETTGFAANGPNFIASCKSWLINHGVVPSHPYISAWEVLEDVMKYIIEPSCVSPTIISYFPKELQHVCDLDPLNGHALRVSTIIHGVEVSDGGVKFPSSDGYRRVYNANAEYRQNVLNLDGNELPEPFFSDLDSMNESSFTTGLGIDRIIALVVGCDIKRALIFPEG
jgi:lysyl-tRNA synthetase class II